MAKLKTITLGELKDHLAGLWALDDSTEVTIGGGNLSFCRAKNRKYKADDKTPAIVDIEFNEVFQVIADPDDAA